MAQATATQRRQELTTFSTNHADDVVRTVMVQPRNRNYATFTLHTGDMVYDVGVLYDNGTKAQHMRVSIEAPADMLPARPPYDDERGKWAAWRRKYNTDRKRWAAQGLAALGITGPLQWQAKADCSCGCSPAFVWRNGSMCVGAQRVARVTLAPAGAL